MNCSLRIIIFAALALATPMDVRAQAGSVGRAIGTELVEKLGQRGAKELLEVGGEAAVREVVEKAVAEGGEQIAREVAVYAERYGARSLLAFREAPVAMAQAMRKVPAELAEGAMRAAAREPAAIAKLVATHGDDVLLVAAKHPGVGVDIAGKLGSEGCAVARQLTTPEAIRLARLGDDLARLPAAERAGVLARIGKSPQRVLEWLEKHPKVLGTAALTTTALVTIDKMLGDAESPGFVERVVSQMKTPIGWILAAFAALVFARAAWWWRRGRKAAAPHA